MPSVVCMEGCLGYSCELRMKKEHINVCSLLCGCRDKGFLDKSDSHSRWIEVWMSSGNCKVSNNVHWSSAGSFVSSLGEIMSREVPGDDNKASVSWLVVTLWVVTWVTLQKRWFQSPFVTWQQLLPLRPDAPRVASGLANDISNKAFQGTLFIKISLLRIVLKAPEKKN